jgi:hypothetical protein
MVVLSLVALVSISAIFIVFVVRSRPQFRFGFLVGHKPLGSGMDRSVGESDMDIYSWHESWLKVEERVHQELPSWKRNEASQMGIVFKNSDGTYVAVSKGNIDLTKEHKFPS